MTKNKFYDSLKQIASLTDEELNIVISRSEERKIKKKTTFLKVGKIAEEAHFLISGCMRLYYDKNGEDISAFFFTENMFTIACESFIAQKPSRHSIETLEDCSVVTVSYKNLQKLFIEVPKINQYFRKVMEERFEAIHNLFTSQILDSPQERYLNLLKTNPNLFNRVPQYQIATFLGITPVSLSRIKRRKRK